MATLFAPVEDGKIVETMSQSSLKRANKTDNGMDKDAFLQLLVAQMQYQDPLEPTSNTEYVAQYAQFSQVEQIQNMARSTDLARASSLVGQTVYIKTTASNGEAKYVEGKVDYVVFENNQAYLAINESLYSMDDLDTIVDLDYKNAYDKAYDFAVRLNKLPGVNGIDMSDAEEIDELVKIYEEMTDYEKSFVAQENKEKLDQYAEKLAEVRLKAEQAEDKTEGAEDKTEGAEDETGGVEDKTEDAETAGSGESSETAGS